MIRALIVLGAMGLLASCAALDRVTAKMGDEIGNTAGKVGSQVGGQVVTPEYQAKENACKELEKRPVPWDEEYQIGGAIALALAEKTNGVFVEPAPSLAPLKELSADALKYKNPTPGTGPKTDLHVVLNRVGKALAAASPRPEIPWTFVALDSPVANAFSAPGGYVFITTGLLKRVANEAQLAGVLAHEVAHVSLKHPLKPYSSAKKEMCLFGVRGELAKSTMGGGAKDMAKLFEAATTLFGGKKIDLDAAGGDVIVAIALKVAEISQSFGNPKEDELAADKMAFELMLFNGYDYREYEKLLKGLPEGGGVFDNPPKNTDRVATIEQVRTSEYKDFPTDTLRAPATPKEFAVLK